MVYQIFADEVLGSGQFGVVYGGMSMTANSTFSFGCCCAGTKE